MKALVLEGPDALPTLRTDVAAPVAGPGEVLVDLDAAALNRRDLWITKGMYPAIHYPVILGSDGVGRIAAVGANVDAGRVGERVVLCPSIEWGDDERYQGPAYRILGLPEDGTFAEQVKVPAVNAVACPAHLSAAEAAALPLAGLTAWRALVTRAGLRAGETVLVTGIGGGVAQLAFQIALAHGATVYVTSGSADKLAAAEALGAAGGVSYREEGWRKALASQVPNGFDVIVDSAGGDGLGELVRLLGMGGRLAFFGGTRGKWPPLLPQHMFFRQVSLLATTMGSLAEFEAMVAFYAERELTPTVDRVFPLAESDAAFARMDEGSQLGKLVLSIR